MEKTEKIEGSGDARTINIISWRNKVGNRKIWKKIVNVRE